MAEVTPGFSNPETAERFETAPDFNWNRKIGIPKLYNAHVKDIPPNVAEALIKQGRKDLWEKKPQQAE